ncbi:MAG: hypothetical protein OER56_03935 [Hyphomicrobiales bacterium]|nr:hypothetical protein [Hyphomicrobiales bacterium]
MTTSQMGYAIVRDDGKGGKELFVSSGGKDLTISISPQRRLQLALAVLDGLRIE